VADEQVRVVRFTCENAARLRALEIIPGDDSVTTLSGKNRQGKSTTLKLVLMLLGAKKSDIPRMLREGAKKGFAELELSNGITVHARIKSNGTVPALKITGADGASYGMKKLTELCGPAKQIDPVKLAGQSAKEQIAMLLDLTGKRVEILELDERRKSVFDGRTIVNREAKNLRGQLSALPVPAGDLPAEPVSTAAILAKQKEAFIVHEANNAERRAAEAVKANLAGEHEALAAEVAHIKDLEGEIAKHRANHERLAVSSARLVNDLVDAERKAAALVDPDITTFEAQLVEAEATNQRIRGAAEWRRLSEGAREKERESDTKSAELETIDGEKCKIIDDAQLPVPGLSYDEDGITLNGMPHASLSDAERVELWLDIALSMKKKGQLKFIPIFEGVHLDEDARERVRVWAKKHGAWVLMEVVRADEGDNAIHIVDGAIVDDTTDTEGE